MRSRLQRVPLMLNVSAGLEIEVPIKVINPVREQMLRVLGDAEANTLVHSDLNRLSSSA